MKKHKEFYKGKFVYEALFFGKPMRKTRTLVFRSESLYAKWLLDHQTYRFMDYGMNDFIELPLVKATLTKHEIEEEIRILEEQTF